MGKSFFEHIFNGIKFAVSRVQRTIFYAVSCVLQKFFDFSRMLHFFFYLLIEKSIIMTGISGSIGIFLGVLGGNIISQAIQIPPVIDVPVIIGAFLGSVVLGLVFGVYPAKKAADLDPIESLRYE